MKRSGPTREELLRRVGELEQRLREAEATIAARSAATADSPLPHLQETQARGERVSEEEFGFLRSKGSAGVVQVSAAPVRNRQGEIIAGVATYRDVTGRKQREREFQRLASFPQLNPNPILEVDTSGRITYSNQAAREVVTGLGPPTKLRDLLPADLKQILLNIKRTGQTHFQREVQVKDAVYLQSISYVEPLQAIRLYGIDISQRKRSEAAVFKSNEEWERTFEAVPDLIAILDTDYHLVRVNRAMAAALGAEPQELAGKHCYELMHRSTYPPDVCPHSLLLQDGQGHTAELREFDRDFLVTTSPLLDDKGQLMGSVHVARDITVRKRAEEALSRLNEELEQRVEARTEELHETVAQLREEVNEREEAEQKAAVLGRLYRLLSRVYESIVHAQNQEELFRQACRIMMEEGDFLLCWIGRVDWEGGLVRAAAQYDLLDDYPQNITISLKDVPEGRGPTGVAVRQGRWDACQDFAADPRMAPWRKEALARGFRSSAAFPLFVGDRVEGVITLYSGQKGFFNTEEISALNSLAQNLSFAMESMDREARRRQAEEEIHHLNEELEQRVKERTAQLEFANRELEAFAYSVSHDLKAPIRAIDGFSRILMLEHAAQLDGEGLRLLEVVRRNTGFMTHLIDDLLALSRLGRHELKKARIDLGPEVTRLIKELRAAEPDRPLELKIKELPPAFGDVSLLRQVLANLLANAFKFTRLKEKAVIEVGGGSVAGETIYYVKDNGIGFDMRYRDKLFGVFQRLHPIGEFEGTGVGLAIVQRILQRHAGRVWAEGKVNEGATFFFTLPAGADNP